MSAGHSPQAFANAAQAKTYRLSDAAKKRIDKELGKYPADQRQSAVMASLAICQDEHGWVSPCVIEEVASYIGMAPIAVQEVATFYNMAAEFLKTRLGIDFNETTPDGVFTLKELECLGACGDAPVMLVNNKRMCSFMDAQKLDALLAELRAAAKE
ncbi:MAG: NAD(P)H-dependent oxidoreductase subunit E [Betaproteobacteria bacterium]|nr:NAD(P)H-dependent oxidoreductase subunit E [Betaproteobacteria bacterium]